MNLTPSIPTVRVKRPDAKTPYQQLWGIVSGAVSDAFNRHPDYLTPKGSRSAATSVVKRVVGTVLSFAEQSAQSRKADNEDGRLHASDLYAGGVVTSPAADGGPLVIRTHSFAHVNERCYQAIRQALFPHGAREVRKDAKRFQRAKSNTIDRLRSEMAAEHNLSLEEAIEKGRAA